VIVFAGIGTGTGIGGGVYAGIQSSFTTVDAKSAAVEGNAGEILFEWKTNSVQSKASGG
jgi:hypothetical protein